MSGFMLTLKLNLCFQSKWHAGSGEGSILTDRLIQKDSRGRPYFPGSTLKGIIRENCEKLSRTLNFPEPPDPHNTSIDMQDAFCLPEAASSPVVRLFGNRYASGGLFFRNAYPVTSDGYAFYSQSRIRMNRKLGTARDGHLFTSEYGLPVEFETTVDGHHHNLVVLEDDDPPFEYCLLIAAIRMTDRLGGDKSTGCGILQNNIKIQSLIYNNKAIAVEQYLQDKASFYLNAEDYQELKGQ